MPYFLEIGFYVYSAFAFQKEKQQLRRYLMTIHQVTPSYLSDFKVFKLHVKYLVDEQRNPFDS